MEADPAVEPDLDTASLILPLPYRIAVIFVLGMRHCNLNFLCALADKTAGVWAWGVNLHYLNILKIVGIGLETRQGETTKTYHRMFQRS